jgi:SAM-dependent methyltransferase
MGQALMGAFWDRHALTIDRERFRAGEQYLGGGGPAAEMLAYVRSLGNGWLERLAEEDDAFGCDWAEVDGVKVSRDLVDSIVELDFLHRICGLPLDSCRVLDIGAGYGRLAHRMTALFPGSWVVCTDPIEVSRAVCRKYLEFRRVSRAIVVAPEALSPQTFFDLAMNVHSWPECTRAEINSWLDWLVARRVPRLFVVPHLDAEMRCNEDERSFRPDIERHGFHVEHHWTGPDCWPRGFYLFRLEGT